MPFKLNLIDLPINQDSQTVMSAGIDSQGIDIKSRESKKEINLDRKNSSGSIAGGLAYKNKAEVQELLNMASD